MTFDQPMTRLDAEMVLDFLSSSKGDKSKARTMTASDKKEGLRRAIEIAINQASAENESNTPDFILAEYLIRCLEAYDAAVKARDTWYKAPTSVPSAVPSWQLSA